MELFRASSQWSTRPKDERFEDLQSMHAATLGYRESARVKDVPLGDIRVGVSGNDLVVTGKAGVPATVSNWAFGQLSNRVGAPASYLRALPGTLASENLNYGLAHLTDPKPSQLLFHANGGLVLRAATSERYSRIWNHEVIERLLNLPSDWNPAPAAMDGARGLYASDHDMFAFMVDNQRRVFESDPGGGLSRGVFVENSEVGASAFRIMTFLYRYVCGNHIVWGAEQVTELALRHVGNAADAFAGKIVAELKRYAESSASELENKIAATKRMQLGANKDEVLDFIFSRRLLSRKVAGEAYDYAERNPVDGDPKSAWGFSQGLTRYSQTLPYADRRVDLDRVSGKILDLAF